MDSVPERRPVTVFGPGGEKYEGIALVRQWTGGEAFRRGATRAAKIVGIAGALILPFGILEPFMFMVTGSLAAAVLLLFVGPYLHLKYWGERASFERVEGACPACKQTGKLGPYVSTEFKQRFTVLCAGCGQTAEVRSGE